MEGATGATGKWQYKCERAADVLESGAWSDCSFIVGTEKEVFKGHKQILALASPVFETMFYGNMPEDGPVLIDDVHCDTFKTLLTFIYTDIIEINSVDEACDLCYVANKYMLQDLVMECSKYLEEHLEAGNACRIYETANLFDMESLRDKCIEIISRNTKEVLNEPSFDNIDIKTLGTVFSLDTLNIDSEVELIEAAARYAKTVDSSSCAEGDGANLDNNLRFRSVVEKIRFLTVTPQQFSASSARSLLPMDEVGAVLMNIVSSDCGVPMPQGLSTCREPRKRVSKETGASGQQTDARDADILYCVRPQTGSVQRFLVFTLHSISVYSSQNERTRYLGTRVTQVLESQLYFRVDTDIWLLGVQVIEPEALGDDNDCYVTLYYDHGYKAHQVHWFTHHGGVADVMFNRPILIKKTGVIEPEALGDDNDCYVTLYYDHGYKAHQVHWFTHHGGVADVMFNRPILIKKTGRYCVKAEFPRGRYALVGCSEPYRPVKSNSVLFKFEGYENNEMIRGLIWRYSKTT